MNKYLIIDHSLANNKIIPKIKEIKPALAINWIIGVQQYNK